MTAYGWGVSSSPPPGSGFTDLGFEEHATEQGARDEAARRTQQGHMGVVLWIALSVDGSPQDA